MAADWLKVVLTRDQHAASKERVIQDACTKLWQEAAAPPTAAMFVTKDMAGAAEYAIYFSPTMVTICHAVIASYKPTATEPPASDEVIPTVFAGSVTDVQALLRRSSDTI